MTLLRLAQVKKIFGYKSHASVYGLIRKGEFPRQVNIGPRSVGWIEAEVLVVCTALAAGQTNEQMRALVAKMHARRVKNFAALEFEHG